MRPLIGSILRLRLLCAAMHRCLFCRSQCVMDGLSRGRRDPATAAREMGVSPRGRGCAFGAVRGDGGLCAGPCVPAVCGLHLFAEVGGLFALLKESGSCRRLLPNVGTSQPWGSGKLLPD